MANKELYDFVVDLLAETEKAYKVTEDDPEKAFWVPKSQAELVKRPDGFYDLTLPEWLAKEKKLI